MWWQLLLIVAILKLIGESWKRDFLMKETKPLQIVTFSKCLLQTVRWGKTDVADQVQLFRLIQSIPSPKAEPFKVWMAQVASERIDEIQDPELAIDRGIEYYRKKGYGEGWIFVDESIWASQYEEDFRRIPIQPSLW